MAEAPRLTLARMVREASVASRDEAEFVRRLRGSESSYDPVSRPEEKRPSSAIRSP